MVILHLVILTFSSTLPTGQSLQALAVGAGISTSTGVGALSLARGPGFSAVGGGAKGGSVLSTSLLVGAVPSVSPMDNMENEVKPSPEMMMGNVAALSTLSTLLGSRPVVKGYSNGAHSKNNGGNKNKQSAPSSSPAPAPRPVRVCWTLSKRCCYEEVHAGYECKDYYAYKYARCHPVVEYKEVCGEVHEMPKHHAKPGGRVKVEESIIKNYDANYGPHVQGYPNGGESSYYRTSSIPHRPHGVSSHPHAPRPVNGYSQGMGHRGYGHGNGHGHGYGQGYGSNGMSQGTATGHAYPSG